MFKRLTIILVLLMCAAIAHAQRGADEESPHPKLITTTAYDSPTEAALAGFRDAMKVSMQYEAGGAVVQDLRDGKYYDTVSYTSYDPGKLLLPLNDEEFNKAGVYRVVGAYHTHTCTPGYIHGYFSVPDVASAQYYHVVTYMMNLCTGNVYAFDPTIDPPDNYKTKADGILTTGRLIAWIQP